MKNILIVLFISLNLNCYSQFDKDFSTELRSFQSLSKPSPNSRLSQYLIQNLGIKYLNRIKFSDKQKSNGKTIRLTFTLYNKNRPGNFRINTGNIELNKKIIAVFKKYPIEKLGLNSTNKLGICSVQLFSKEKNKTIINASSIAICDISPILEGCQNIKSHSKLTSYFYDSLRKHIVNNFSLSIFDKKQLKRLKSIRLFPRFSVDLEGNIYNINEEDFKLKSYKNNPKNLKSPKHIDQELYRITKSFDKIVKPATRNGKAIFFNYDTFYSFVLEK